MTIAPRFTCLLLLLALLVPPGCGGGSTEIATPAAQQPANGVPGPGGPDNDGQLPPPNPGRPPVWNASAASFARVPLFGAFPSDLVLHGRTLFAVDADQIEGAGATILPVDVSGTAPAPSQAFSPTTVHDSDLVDSLGAAGDLTNPVGFGFFLNDLLIVSDTLGFVLVNAGGSDSMPTLSNVVVFNPSTGAIRQTFNLATTYLAAAPLFDSAGLPVPGSNQFTQAGAEGLAYVATGATTGFLYVAMSNLIFGAPSFGAVKYPGTVQILAVDSAQTAALTAVSSPGQATKTILTQGYNPVALRVITAQSAGGPPTRRLLVTCAGTTGLNAAFQLVPVTSSFLEAYDATTGSFTASFHLGLAGLAGIRPAYGRDGAGHEVGFFPSSVTGEIFLLRLDGLFAPTVDFGKLALLRGPGNGIPITAAQAGGPGGNITGVALAPDGRHLAVTGFGDLFAVPQLPGRLFLLTLPADLVTGSAFGPSFTPGSTEFGAAPGRGVGNVVLLPNDGTRPDVFVNVSGTLDAGFFGAGPASLGTLQTHGLIK